MVDVKTGALRLVPPRSQAFRKNYYRLNLDSFESVEETLHPGFAEETLNRIESDAARAIGRLVRGIEIEPEDRLAVATFCVVQDRRTPAGRRDLKFMDELTYRLQQEIRLQNRESFLAEAREAFPDVPVEEMEQFRIDTLREIEDGTLVFVAPPEREVLMIFIGLYEIVVELLTRCDWHALAVDERVPDLVLPDVGVTHVDQTPRHRGAGVGWYSSPGSETVVPLDPRLALLVIPGEGRWSSGVIGANEVEDFNLRSYAASEAACFATSKARLRDLARRARRDPGRVARYRPRPKVLWVAESDGPLERSAPKEFEFRGYSVEGERRARFVVGSGSRAA